MKQVFFTLIAISIPAVVMAGLLYMFGQGLYTVVSDWYERRQIEQLRRETLRRRQQKEASSTATKDPEPPRS